MRNWFTARLFACFCIVGAFSPTFAQSIPNYGGLTSLKAPFRVGVRVANSANGFVVENAFEQKVIDDIQEFLDPSQYALVVGVVNANQGAISTVFDLRGVTALGDYAQNSTTLTLRFVRPDGTVINNSKGQACSFTFTGATRQIAYDDLDNATDIDANAGDPRGEAIFDCLYGSFARFSPLDPLAGNPTSLQATLVRNAMDLSIGDSLIEQGEGAPGDPWMVGASYSGGSAGRFDYQRIDARVQRSFRIFEGNRAQLKIDVPFQYSRLSGSDSYSTQIGLGLEYPVIARRWSLEPRASYGIVYSEGFGSVGHIAQASVTSRAVFDGIGRGRLVLGNMLGYSTTLSAPGTAISLNPDLKNVSLRNGLAYELPLKGGAGGRNKSVRASYTHTKFFGDDLFNDSFHEFTLSFGLRGREESVRATRDLIRFNLNGTLAKGYKSFSAGIGFRF